MILIGKTHYFHARDSQELHFSLFLPPKLRPMNIQTTPVRPNCEIDIHGTLKSFVLLESMYWRVKVSK